MRRWTKEWLVRASGQHIASGAGVRVQVMEVPERSARPWPVTTGELLIVCLEGACDVVVAETRVALRSGDQALVERGEAFQLERSPEAETGAVQLIWAPGISGGP